MSKRRISDQQSARIAKKQKLYRQHTASEHNLPTADGLVIARYARHAQIESEEGTRIRCLIRPNLDSIVAGDRVVWQLESDGQGVIISRYPRHSVLGRPDKRGQLRPVAANITQMMVVVAPKPEISWSLLDSYLVLAEHLHLEACIVLNKIDLAAEELKQQLVRQYEPLGYSILFTGRSDTKGYKHLQKALDDETSVFVGQSGVGKSSLIAHILPGESGIQTAAISSNSELGCHTTSNSFYYHLPTGGALIDSPGVREFGMWHMPPNEIAKGYREFAPLLQHCKFRDCNHRNAPGCALLNAVKEGLITSARYNNFIKIITQLAK